MFLKHRAALLRGFKTFKNRLAPVCQALVVRVRALDSWLKKSLILAFTLQVCLVMLIFSSNTLGGTNTHALAAFDIASNLQPVGDQDAPPPEALHMTFAPAPTQTPEPTLPPPAQPREVLEVRALEVNLPQHLNITGLDAQDVLTIDCLPADLPDTHAYWAVINGERVALSAHVWRGEFYAVTYDDGAFALLACFSQSPEEGATRLYAYENGLVQTAEKEGVLCGVSQEEIVLRQGNFSIMGTQWIDVSYWPDEHFRLRVVEKPAYDFASPQTLLLKTELAVDLFVEDEWQQFWLPEYAAITLLQTSLPAQASLFTQATPAMQDGSGNQSDSVTQDGSTDQTDSFTPEDASPPGASSAQTDPATQASSIQTVWFQTEDGFTGRLTYTVIEVSHQVNGIPEQDVFFYLPYLG